MNISARWAQFLGSLATRGGAIFLLVIACLSLGGLLVHVMHHGDTGEAASLVHSTFAGFAGALLLALKTSADKVPNDENQNPPAGAQEKQP